MLSQRIQLLMDRLDGQAGILIKNNSTGETLFECNPDTVFPAASIIKLPILWTLFKRVEEKTVDLCDSVRLADIKKVGGFGILKDLSDDAVVTVKDCAMLMIVLSDNTATNYLIELLGMEAINATAKEDLKMQHASLQREMMDSEAKARGLDNFISPKDVMKFFDALFGSEQLSEQSRIEMLDILKRQQCNNKLPAEIEDDFVFAHKTGDLPQTEHDAGIMYLRESISVVVMLKDLSSNAEGIALHNALGRIIYEEYK